MNVTTSTFSNQCSNARLKVTVLSAYDLPVRDAPTSVTITVGAHSVQTGPPVQRHKDRNAVKFSDKKNGRGNVVVNANLSDLYNAIATVELNYASTRHNTLKSTYSLDQLKIHEKTWLILNLERSQQDVIEDVPPSIRLQMTLEGPYRTEISALIKLGKSWFDAVDGISARCQVASKKLPTMPDSKFILIPAAPILASVVVSLPIILGVLTVFLPMFLPVLVAVGSCFVALLMGALFIYGSSRKGRSHCQSVTQPLVQTLLSTPSGQRMVYQTGPRPTPVSVARAVLPRGIWGKLVASLVMDGIGSSSYLLPLVGELSDVAWAPVQTVLIIAMYDSTSPKLKYVSFVEEILPLTDIVPAATLGWLIEFGVPFVSQHLGLDSLSATETVLAPT